MISFPPCKINLGLNVVLKRPDGYHEIETCFYPVPWTDMLEIVPSEKFEFEHSGIAIPGQPEDNLCVKAFQLLKADFDLKPVTIHLHKIIPTGAGLGGGSSDAAHTLRLLNTIFNLELDADQLRQYALQLGSDCSFFIEDKAMLGTGRGEVLENVEINLQGRFIVLIKPALHIATTEAYSSITPAYNSKRVKDVAVANFVNWKSSLTNDFEKSLFEKYPVIPEIKEKLYHHGAAYASMSGSGSAVYGIFDRPVDLKNHFPNMIYWSGVLN